MQIAYFVNQYPKVSHTFIRREILALESAGLNVRRYALRGWDAAVVDPLDEAERGRTRFVLRGPLMALAGAAARVALRRPRAFGNALTAAWRQWRGGDRGLAHNLVSVAEACVLLEWMRADGITHVHAHFGTNSALIVRLARLLGGPTYSFTVHGPDEFDSPRQLGLRDKIADARFVVAISEFTRAQLQRWARPQDMERIHVVHCGLDRAFFGQPAGLPAQAPRLLCIGRLCREKGQLLLVQAVTALRSAGRDVELVLAGDGEDRAAIEALIAQAGGSTGDGADVGTAADAGTDAGHAAGGGAGIRLLGWVDEATVRAELERARALVLPSRMEGLPMVLMESLAMRRPVISTFVAGIPELVAHADAGWLVPAGDRAALEHAIVQCLEAPPQTLAAMAARGRAHVQAAHDVDTEAARLRRLFEESAR